MYNQGDNVMYRALDANWYPAIILHSKVDFENNVINTDNAIGNFDYLISYQARGRNRVSFCQHEDLMDR